MSPAVLQGNSMHAEVMSVRRWRHTRSPFGPRRVTRVTPLPSSSWAISAEAPKKLNPAPGEWIAHCAAPGRLLDDATAEALVGGQGLRHVTFDCATSWVFPGDSPGWYVLPPGRTWLDDWAAVTDSANVPGVSITVTAAPSKAVTSSAMDGRASGSCNKHRVSIATTGRSATSTVTSSITTGRPAIRS